MYPKPDRSNHAPNVKTTETGGAIDIGWNEGFLSDGRPYRAEVWAQDQVTSLVVFMSTRGLETMTNIGFVELLEREGLVRYLGSYRSAAAMPFTDASGQDMWSINLVIGDSESALVDTGFPIRPYGVAGDEKPHRGPCL